MNLLLHSLFPSACIVLSLCPYGTLAIAAQRCPDADPIVVGDVSSMSGRFAFPESQAAAALVFKSTNFRCGVNGHPIQYEVLDDGGGAATAEALTRKLVFERHAVALIGGTSVQSCGVNAAFYAATPIASIPGTGTGPRCFDSPNISPPNSGLFAIVALSLTFAAENLAPHKLCLIGNAHPSIPGNFREPVDRFERATGKSATVVNQDLRPDSDAEKAVAQLIEAGCDVAFVGTLADFGERASIALGRSRNRDLKLILAPEAYTEKFAARLPQDGEGRIFVVTDTDFLDSTRAGMRRIRSILAGSGTELSPFAVGGALSALIALDAMRGIQGPVNNESMLSALGNLGPYDTQGVSASPYVFTWPEEKRMAAGINVVVLKRGKWVHVTKDWVRMPKAAT